MHYIGTVARGIKAPIIRAGDDLKNIVITSIENAQEEDCFTYDDGDVICLTESIVAKAQGNMASLDQIAIDIKNQFPHLTKDDILGVLFPILSRNRFSMILQAIKKAFPKLVIQLSYPADEVGNHLVSEEEFFEADIDINKNFYSQDEFRTIFKNTKHPFTGVDYIEYYQEIAGPDAKIILSNNPKAILEFTKNIIVSNTHKRKITKKILMPASVKVIALDEIMLKSVNGSGYHPEYGLLGCNKASDDTVKLFPRDGQGLVEAIQNIIWRKVQKKVEVMVYGDGAFKDPIGGIWELADPVVAPFYTDGLVGKPNELKFKYLADVKFSNLNKEDAEHALKKLIKDKDKTLVGSDSSLGTTPRRYVDLLGSLADLMGGSGDKGTPIIYIKGYFNNYAD